MLLHEQVQVLVREIAGLAEIDRLVVRVELGEVRGDRALVVGAGAPGGRAAEKRDDPILVCAGRAVGPPPALFVDIDGLALDRRTTPAVERLVGALGQVVVFGEMIERPVDIVVVGNQMRLRLLLGLLRVVVLDARYCNEIAQGDEGSDDEKIDRNHLQCLLHRKATLVLV
jgi:hypothetical protein